MTINWVWMLVLSSLAVLGESLPVNAIDNAKKNEQMLRPKPKRAQETLMFGNQQNRQVDAANNPYNQNNEKRALNAAGLDGLKVPLPDENKFANVKAPSNSLNERDSYSPYNKNYEYGKVLVKELEEETAQPHVWDVLPYSRYNMADDWRKRSEKSSANVRSTTLPTTGFQTPLPTQHSLSLKRSVPIYSEPRYKRDVDIDPETVWKLLSLWESEQHNRDNNWRKYANDEYDNEDDSGLMEDEEPRNAFAWLNGPAYAPYRYTTDTLAPSDVGIVRTHPPSYYNQYGNQFEQQYESPVSAMGPYVDQYNNPYTQRTYYAPEKRFIVARKRSKSYEPYVGVPQLQLGTQQRDFPYQHHYY